jgi:hypothetical protein
MEIRLYGEPFSPVPVTVHSSKFFVPLALIPTKKTATAFPRLSLREIPASLTLSSSLLICHEGAAQPCYAAQTGPFSVNCTGQSMIIDIGVKQPVNGDQVFVIGRHFSRAEPPFVLLYDTVKARRVKRNIKKLDPENVVTSIGAREFVKVDAPHWGTVWFRAAKIRDIRALTPDALATSSAKFGSFVLFAHDPEPPDQHAGFLLYGLDVQQTTGLLTQAACK